MPAQEVTVVIVFKNDMRILCFYTSIYHLLFLAEHVGWLSPTDVVFGIEPQRRVFATYNAVHGGSKLRFICRTPVSAIMSGKRVERSIAATLPSEYMVLLSVESELGTLGLVTVNIPHLSIVINKTIVVSRCNINVQVPIR